MSNSTEQSQETESDLISFGLIADAGEAKSLAFMALGEAKEGNFEGADDFMRQSGEAYLRAHHKQTELLVKEANGDHTPVNVMLIHAQDHLMCANQAREFIAELIDLYRIVQPETSQDQ